MRFQLYAVLFSCALVGLAACADQSLTWYEQRCANYGLKPGTADFEACVSRDREWEDAERARSRRPGGQT